MKPLPGGSANVSLYRRGTSDYQPKGALPFFRELLAPFAASFGFVVVLTVVTVLAQIGALLLLKPLLDEIIPGKLAGLPMWGVAMAALVTVGAAAQWGGGNRIGALGSKLADDLRNRLYRHTLRLPVGFFDVFPSGEITSRIMQDTIAIERFIIERLPYAFVNVLILLGAGATLFWIDPLLGGLACMPLPLFILASFWFNKRQYLDIKEYFGLNDQLNSAIHESVNGIKPIKAACREERRAAFFASLSAMSRRTEFRINHLNVLFTEASGWLLALGVALLWYAGAHLTGGTEAGSLQIGALVAATGIARFFYAPLQAFPPLLHQWAGAVAASGRIQEFLGAAEEQTGGTSTAIGTVAPAGQPQVQPAQPAGMRGAVIECSDLHFSYIPGTEVLHGINLNIRPGEMVGLVGRSGAGKSTLINLICRFYLPQSGRLLIDGQAVDTLPLEAYRRRIGLVLQEPFLFRTTIEENIRFAKPEATRAEVEDAATLAQAHNFISRLEKGYDTVVGDKGARLSVGEIQRIAIARALLQNPDILILDEATSNLDAETEHQLQQAIQEVVKGRTTIAIAHRLSTLRHANRLIVLDQGRVVEEGTHDELSGKSGGAYAGLLHAQSHLRHLQGERNAWLM